MNEAYKNENISGPVSDKRCYTVEDLQLILGISRPSVYKLIAEDAFRCVKVGGKYRISRKSFDEWLDERA